MGTEPQHLVAQGYDTVAERYAELERDAPWPRLAWLDDLLARLPDGSPVLDLGCGNGLPAGERIARRHRLTGVDVSARQIELARRHVPDGEFSTGDILKLAQPPGSFTAVTAFYTFDHIPRERLTEMFGLIHTWLADGGYLLCCVEIEDLPGTVADWLGAPMYFSSYEPGVTRRLLTEAGFDIVRDRIEAQSEGGHEVSYLWLLARRR
jgi:cyclopropane fatty-acyl-phospholipid synthase-like methyltransferase